MCSAMMAVSFAACGTNQQEVINDTNSIAYRAVKVGDAESTLEVLSTSSFLEHLSQMFQLSKQKKTAKERQYMYLLMHRAGRTNSL